MSALNFSLSKPQIPSISPAPWIGLYKLPSLPPSSKTPRLPKPSTFSKFSKTPSTIQAIYQKPPLPLFSHPIPPSHRPNPTVSAGRGKKKPGGPSTGRIEGNADVRREAKRRARIKSRRLAENLFYRLKNPSRNYADNFNEEELQMIGLGYDRMVRFMEKDDPRLRHPYDWYKYGEYGPYSWRGIVLGEPIRGRVSDECVTMIGEVRDHEEWEKIEQHEMAMNFTRRLNSMDRNVGFRYFWVFVRHPKWRITELPWQQWTLVCEVVLEAGKKRLDKWSLMGRLGNKSRALITQCAAWMRPDIIYVKRPIYQCRFEPQDDFFKVLGPLLDPSTESQYLFEVKLDDGRVEMCTYFGGLCKIVRANPKAFVDDVVKAYDKLSDERKSACLEFLLSNHPMELLHPYTKEWKAKLEEMELGCDSPDEDFSDDDGRSNPGGTEIIDWIEDDDDDGSGGDNEGDEDEDIVLDAGEVGDEELGIKEETLSPEETESFWEEQFQRAVRSDVELGIKEESPSPEYRGRDWEEEIQRAVSSNEEMEKLVRKSVETSTKYYKQQLRAMEKLRVEEEQQKWGNGEEEFSVVDEDKKVEEKKDDSGLKQIKEEWKIVGRGPRRRVKISKMPPELFLRAAVRPFTYRNLVKEIVLMRRAIIDGEISGKQ